MIIDKSIKEEIKSKEKNIGNINAFVGFDGFVDKIVTPIDKIDQETKSTTFIPTINEFSKRIASASGKSSNIELFEKLEKLGGNGPIMANAQLSLGLNVQYVGALGLPQIHPIFKNFSSQTNAISLANPGITNALEFDDGKIMLGTMKGLQSINYDNLNRILGSDKLITMLDNADSISIVNWTMLTNLTDLLKNLLSDVLPYITKNKYFFFDLADPEKRTQKDILEILKLLKDFEQFGNVILGLNLRESSQIANLLKLNNDESNLSLRAKEIKDVLKINTVVIHPVESAHCASNEGTFSLEGPYCKKPKITTGGGDHFNAGFVSSKLIGLSDLSALAVAVSTSGFYVRNGYSPSFNDIIEFIDKY